jgi:septum formation inhibitor MinC
MSEKESRKVKQQKLIAKISQMKLNLGKDPKLSDQDLQEQKNQIKKLEKQLRGMEKFNIIGSAKETLQDFAEFFGKKSKKSKESKAIMDLPTNAPRTKDVFKTNVKAKEGGKVRGRKRGGTQLGDLDKDGKMSGYEKVRQKAIEKSMAAQRKK